MPTPLPLLVVALPALAAPAPDDAPPPTDATTSEHRTEVRGGRFDPSPSAVIDRERLAETAGADLPAALDSEPGLAVTRLGGLGAFATLSIRGSTPEQVLIALDGIPLNPADGAPVDLSTLPLGPLDAVHIHRGRAPWSLGSTGLGGALVLHTRTPEAPLSADAELGLGAFETTWLRAFAGLEHPLGAGDDRLGLALAVDGLHTASDFRFVNDSGTAWTSDDDHLDTRENAASDQLSTLARADLRLGTLRLTLLDLYTHVARGLPSLGVTPTTRSRFTFDRHLVALRLDAAPGPLVIAATTWLAASTSVVSDPLGEIGLERGRSTLDSLVPGAVLTVRAPLRPSPDLRLVPSLHLAWRLEATDGTRAAPADRHIASLAAELLLRHRVGLEVAGGLRAETDLAQTSLATFLEGALALPHLRLTLGARLAPRLPSLFELHGDTGLALGNPDLVPELARTLELGLRWEPALSDHTLALSLMSFATWAEDLIQFIQNAQGVTRPENIGAARLFGLELALEAHLFDHLRLRSALTLMDTTDTSDIAARRGKQLPLRPTLATSHRLSLDLADPRLGALSGALGLYLELDHVAGNHLDFANLVALPARTLLGAGAFVRADHAEVTLSLSNLLGDRVQDLAGYPLPGLTTMLSLRLVR